MDEAEFFSILEQNKDKFDWVRVATKTPGAWKIRAFLKEAEIVLHFKDVEPVGFFCPLTAVGYCKTGYQTNCKEAGIVGQYLRMENELINEILKTADGSPGEMRDKLETILLRK